MTVTSEVPLVQTASGERSFTIATESVAQPAARQPQLRRAARAGAGREQSARQPDAGDAGWAAAATATSCSTARPRWIPASTGRPRASASKPSPKSESSTSGYQAEYGRSSGLQINAVTKSGTNQFRGSLYDVERKSKWNANSKTNILNGDPKAFQDERDWGFAMGGPVGKPGGSNKLFFYFNHEQNPRNFGNTVTRYRMPTALERRGDFSQSTDNLGNPFPYIKDPLLPGACNATTQAGCFADGGVLGRIPAEPAVPDRV